MAIQLSGSLDLTGSLQISGSINDIYFVDFDQKDSAAAVGRLGWDAGEGTLTIGLSGGNLNIPIGVNNFETAYNEDSSSISKGDVVRVSGAQGNRVAVKKANNWGDEGSATTIALAAETIGVGAEGKVILSGPLKGVNTTAFTEGDLLYVSSTPGGLTNIKPQAPFHEVRVGVAQRIHASVGIINVKVNNGYEIDELHNVRITTASLANNQLLAYSGSVWRNETINNLGIAITGSNTFIGNQTITGSLVVTGSATINSGSIRMPNRPAFRVVGTSSTDRVAQTTLSGSYTTVHYNEGNHYNNSTGIFTAPIAGLYNIYFNGRVGSVNAQQQVIVYKNGEAGVAQLMWEAAGNTGAVHFGVNGISKLEVGDTLEAKVAIGSIQFDGNDSFGATYIG